LRWAPILNAAVPFYGAAPPADDIAKIKAAMLIQYAEADDGINGQWADFENGMKAAKVNYAMHNIPAPCMASTTTRHRASARSRCRSRRRGCGSSSASI
jgi:dienelactone hydrolase